jgi:hypothetical protein
MKRIAFFLFAFCVPTFCHADVLSLDNALRATYTACVGIDDDLSELKKMAGINTVVTGVGTGLGMGATVIGIIKTKKDELREKLDKQLRDLRNMSNQEFLIFLADVSNYKQYQDMLDKEQKANKESKKLGNWRTGLMAGNTATNIAGAIISGNNKVHHDLQTQIDNCKQAVENLQNSIMQAKFDGEDVSEATEIANACHEFVYVDISPINKRANGAMISSVVGATTGFAGTITSAVANSENVRKENAAKQGKKTDEDWKKEKNINTTANVLAGTSTVASGVATVFNATQIKAIKKVASVAEKCTEVLK